MVSRCLSTCQSFIRVKHIGHDTRPSSVDHVSHWMDLVSHVNLPGVSSSAPLVSAMSSSSRYIEAVISAAFALLDLVDIRGRLFPSLPLAATSISSAFRFGECGDAVGGGFLANCKIARREFVNASTASLIAQFPLSFDSWSDARQRGHFPSTARLLLMHREQNV